eukprot:Protomagalhaensia_wolfi_Nauph_80__6219@NODE_933_length_1871_cov_508_844978_g682_i1_p1_GENE_NODE_933_length_1871_cov_508_844978_g682_i1NODE_933_length_1871_cov_508_844978_g682_i1_p1_ORF_typecomplete_len452_score114_26Peptidase_M18/PF02127_15/1_2e130Peptidase_M42/PF05343_14/1_6e06_NODE_933_length_1871_cov_508_844978_g682_i12281583
MLSLIDYLNSCGSPYHAVSAAVDSILQPAGYSHVADKGQSQVYLSKNGALLAAQAGDLDPSQVPKLVILASHSDSPCLRLRPHSKLEAENCTMLGIETYGGGLWRTWFDRGLAIAGKVVFQGQGGKLESKLVRIEKPIAYIPSLCIHLQTQDEVTNFKYNKEDHLRPIIGIKKNPIAAASDHSADHKEDSSHAQSPQCRQAELHFDEELLEAVATELRVEASSIMAWDLCLFDSQPAQLSGISEEFIDAPGLDNKLSMYCNFQSLVQAGKPAPNTIHIAVAFNHEEVGSQTMEGADSVWFRESLNKVLDHYGITANLQSVLETSLLLSCDAAHAVHPNYSSKHQAAHKPLIGNGVTLKVNANQRYATTCFGTAFIRSLPIQFQEVEVRNDSPCGTTIGPITSSWLASETIDVGPPIWAMHAAREVCAVSDVQNLIQFGIQVYRKWEPESSQ